MARALILVLVQSKNHTVAELLEDLSEYWNFENASYAYTVTDNVPFHEAELLKLNCDKALSIFEMAISITISKYD